MGRVAERHCMQCAGSMACQPLPAGTAFQADHLAIGFKLDADMSSALHPAANLGRGDAQHEGPAGAGAGAVLPQLRLAPKEDGQVVLEDAPPGCRSGGVRGCWPVWHLQLQASDKLPPAPSGDGEAAWATCRLLWGVAATSSYWRSRLLLHCSAAATIHTRQKNASHVSLLCGQQLAQRRQAQVGHHLAAQLQPPPRLSLHLLPIDAAAGQQRGRTDEVCMGRRVQDEGVGGGRFQTAGGRQLGCRPGERHCDSQSWRIVQLHSPTSVSSSVRCEPLIAVGALTAASAGRVATPLAAAVAAGLPPPSCLCNSALMPVNMVRVPGLVTRRWQRAWALCERCG